MKLALIDGDVLVHAAANMSERAHPGGTEPISHVLHGCKLQLQGILDKVQAENFRVMLSGDKTTNFRYDLFPAYKEGRPPKPPHFKAIRQYLIDNWYAEVVHGEADDAMAQAMWHDFVDAKYAAEFYDAVPEQGLSTIICSVDKDLRMIPGWHYSWQKNRQGEVINPDNVWVSEVDGMRSFFRQLLMGDNIDNIPGLPGVGPKLADQILEDAETPEVMARRVTEEYGSRSVQLDMMLLSADLLWIQRGKSERGSGLVSGLIDLDEAWEVGAHRQPTKVQRKRRASIEESSCTGKGSTP